MNSTLKNILFWMGLIVIGATIWELSTSLQRTEEEISFSEFIERVKADKVDTVVLTGNEVTGTYKVAGGEADATAKTFRTYAPPQYQGLANFLDGKVAKIDAKRETPGTWTTFLVSWAPILLMIGFWIFIMRQMQSGGNKALSFGKSRAKLSSSTQKKVTFKDVAGVDEAKDELQEIIEFLREPQKFQKLGGRIPKGVLLMGPPGTGKTLLALASGLAQVLDDKRYAEIIVTRVTVPIGEDIGFLPGTEEEKMTPWMGALEDNLDVLNKTDDEAGEWGRAATRDLIRSRIKVKSLNFMRGRTFLNKFLIIDEAQTLTPKQMKTLITRAGPGTKVVVLGNISQIDTPYLTEGSSGLTYVVDRFKGWPHAGHVTLARGERSRLADFASDVL